MIQELFNLSLQLCDEGLNNDCFSVFLLIVYSNNGYLYAKDKFMANIKDSDFWEHLVEEIEPLMRLGESLINETQSLVEKYNVDLTSIMDWEMLPAALQNEIRSYIVSLTDDMTGSSLLGLLQTDVLYQSIFEKLETQYARLDRKDLSSRAFLLHLMSEVMESSISSGTMKLSDWHELLEERKEASRVENVGEYVYKKLCIVLRPEKQISIYDFFYNKTSLEDIDRLLCETKDSLLLASMHRRQTKKYGQGMSRLIIDCIYRWQDDGLMKPLKSVFPFCQCLQTYWNDEINLGTRQGLEATYKQRL